MRYTILSIPIEIDTPSPEIHMHIDNLYGAFPRSLSDTPIANYLVTSGYAIEAEMKTYTICRNGHVSGHYDGSEFLWRLEQMVMKDVMECLPHFFFFHAAVLANNHGAVIFPGSSGSGKSTLAMALAERNFYYLSDELAPIEKKTYNVYPYPRKIKLRETSFDLFSISRNIPKNKRTQEAHFDISDCPAKTSDTMHKVKYILFPCYTPAAKPGLVPVSKALAVSLLAQCSSDFCTSQRDFYIFLSELVNNARCYKIITNDIEESCSIVRELMENQPIATPVTMAARARLSQ